jgi:alpha-tubulin suppressor-like RCC1 family protein
LELVGGPSILLAVRRLVPVQRRLRGATATLIALIGVTLTSGVACETPSAIDWRVMFADGSPPAGAVLVRGEVRTGGCDGAVRFTTEVRRGEGEGMSPGALPPGRYGFRAEATTANCEVIAEGCVEITLPADAPVVVTLESVPARARCPAPTCTDGVCANADMGTDASTTDAGARDADVRDTGASDAASSEAGPPDGSGLEDAAARDAGPPDPRVVRALAAGALHTCALMGDGNVQCWGDAAALGRPYTESGTASLTDGEAPVIPVPGLPAARAITAGSFHTCIITAASGEVFCWGHDNASGELGDPARRPDTFCTCAGACDCTGAAIRAQIPPSELPASSIAAGRSHSCAVVNDGSVWCWGLGDAPLGVRADLPADAGTPVARGPGRVVGVTDAISVAASEDATCAALRDGRVLCWGLANDGQLGDGMAAGARAVPGPATLPADFVALEIVAGSQHFCARAADARTYCWGNTTDGQVGRGSSNANGTVCTNRTLESTPISCMLAATAPVRSVSGGGITGSLSPTCNDGHTCAIVESAADGGVTERLRCWGSNELGQCGAGGPIATALASGATVPLETPIRAVEAGGQHTCAVTGESWDRVWCWGLSSTFSYLLTGPAASIGEPARIPVPGTR